MNSEGSVNQITSTNINHLFTNCAGKYSGFATCDVAMNVIFLREKQQCILFNGSFSDIRILFLYINTIYCDIPHGSSLDPLLYNIFANEVSFYSKMLRSLLVLMVPFST